ncbi:MULTISPECIES: hypothetical protein [Actinoalloteichus]|uniref:PPE family domain-containing protein n=1 Tax=Actinoalloteichus fjordicus TaxID=1612552 RepID=A0AAC9L7B0_9PSEU|nr:MULTISPECIES: hypothetical protein [Actinoalloteichus]APU12196.1 hypothetical protein UA74_00485 [Actinoalloteichus fjordicus]APU18148.1 hypothetical protein UA75_00485 [Actinoalloteichus sp. GBA129-24]
MAYQANPSDRTWDHTNAQAISAALNSDPAGASPEDMEVSWKGIADRFLELGQYIESSLSTSNEVHQGVAGEKSRGAVSPLAVYALEADSQARQIASATALQANYQATAKFLTPTGSPEPSKDFLDTVVPGMTGYTDQRNAYDQENQRAREIMENYQSNTNANLASSRGFEAPPNTLVTIAEPNLGRADDGMPATFGDSSLPNGGTDANSGTDTGGRGGSNIPGGGSDGGSGGGNGSTPEYRPPTGPPPVGPDFHYPVPQPPTPGQPIPPPVIGAPGPSGPPGGGLLPPLGGIGRPSGNIGGNGPGGIGGRGPVGGRHGGFGGPAGGRAPGGFGPGGSGFGPGSGGPGGNGFGPGGATGVGGTGGGRMPGGFGPTGGGAGGMPGGGVAGGGGAGGRNSEGDEDKEHKRADYLIEMDDIFTDGTKVAPPVFGDEAPPRDR